MREILFRAKRVDNGEWIEGCLVIRKDTGNNAINCYIIRPSYVHFNNSHIVHTEVDPETVSQFTGLLDKHGNKIFENDVVKFRVQYGTLSEPNNFNDLDSSEEFCGYVKYDNFSTMFVTQTFNGGYFKFSKIANLRKNNLPLNIEVIGNRWEKE